MPADDTNWQKSKPQCRTMQQVIKRQAECFPEKIFIHSAVDGSSFTYSEVDKISDRLAAGLLENGGEPGRHVAIVMENRPEFILLIFALLKTGAIIVPINTASKGQQLNYLIDFADIETIICDDTNLPAVEEISKSKDCHLIVVGEDSNTNIETISYNNLLDSDLVDLPEPRFTDLAMLLFTSGTTGRSKAIMMCQGQIAFWAQEHVDEVEVITDDIEYVCLPLFHGNALLMSTLGLFTGGASIVLVERFSASGFWNDIRKFKVTRFNAIGAMVNILWTKPESNLDREHCVRLAGLAPVPKFCHEFENRFGVKIFAGYGLTDFAMAATLRSTEPRDKLDSVGKPRPGITIKIVDDDDFEVPQGEAGEIVLRSDHPWGQSMGYYKMPEETLAAHRNQWFHTGDRGYFDADGYLHFADRKKDAIRRRGENISAFEVEEIILEHPEVAQVAVYPVTSELSEDEVAASVVLREAAKLDEAELIEFCKNKMAYFMVPRYLEFTYELPTTASKKIEKTKLRTRAEKDLSKLWDREKNGIKVTR